MQYGAIKMWDSRKGFGFIVTEDDDDLFVHANDLDVTLKGRALPEGLRVKFDVRRDMRGDKAVNVRRA